VERALVGESERLKEYVIGVEVFDRDERYDPRVDSIVRVEAGRLRTKLEEYYRGSGSDDAIVIKLEKGGYAPEFRRRDLAGGAPAVARSEAATDADRSRAAPARGTKVYRVAGLGVVVVAAAGAIAWWLAQRADTAERAAHARPV